MRRLANRFRQRLERLRGDRGSLSVAVVLWTPVVMVMAGFVVDIGFLISKREHAADVAQQAARRVADDLNKAGLYAQQQVIEVNETPGPGGLGNCEEDARRYLQASGEQATLVSCAITGTPGGVGAALQTVTVTIRITSTPLFAGFIQEGTNTVTATGTAHPLTQIP